MKTKTTAKVHIWFERLCHLLCIEQKGSGEMRTIQFHDLNNKENSAQPLPPPPLQTRVSEGLIGIPASVMRE
jgi:hypothetical protein